MTVIGLTPACVSLRDALSKVMAFEVCTNKNSPILGASSAAFARFHFMEARADVATAAPASTFLANKLSAAVARDFARADSRPFERYYRSWIVRSLEPCLR